MKTLKTNLIAMCTALVMMMTGNHTAKAASPISEAPTIITSTTVTAPNGVRNLSYIRSSKRNVLHRFDYELDDAGRVVSKMMSDWDATNECWQPKCLYRAQYGEDVNRLLYSTYVDESHGFGEPVVTEYDSHQMDVLLKTPVK